MIPSHKKQLQIFESIAQWNKKGFKDHAEYIDWISENRIVLDGEFSIQELEALIAEIKAIQATWEDTQDATLS